VKDLNIVNNKTFLVRFPNESEHYEMPLDMSLFKVIIEFNDEIFGWYDGSCISIKK